MVDLTNDPRPGPSNPFTLANLQGALLRGDVALGIGVLAILAIMLVPLPPWLMDFLLALSITSSVLVLMVALLIHKPLEFNAFPAILLLTTLFRLALNVASTRLVLSEGHNGPESAGAVINAFGAFVMSGDFVIGIIVFIILVIVNFVVITKGASRIAEVAARFALDSMPGKQMAIDADLSSGLISEDEARRRRRELEEESSFFGSMDGASKFVRGDAIAGILITAINLIGGIIIGMVSHQMSFADASDTYTRLTVGDGLVSQIPALIISVAAALLVTKAGVEGAADKALGAQLTSYPAALGLVAGVSFVIGMLPGMPLLIFWTIAAAAGVLAFRLAKPEVAPVEAETPQSQAMPEETAQESLAMDDIRVELGFGLLPLLNDLQGRRLPDQVKALRRALAQELGFVLPSVRILDNVALPHSGYALKIRELEAGQGELRIGKHLAMDPSGRGVQLPGEPTREPAFGLEAMWIDDSLREEASLRNYTVVDPATVLSTHLTEVVKEHLPDLLTYAELRKLVKELPKDSQDLMNDVVPTHITWSGVQRILQNLLKERVSIRDLSAILEAIAEIAPATTDLLLITEHVRARLARQLCFQFRNAEGALPIITLSPSWEQTLGESLVGERHERQLSLAPSKLHQFVQDIRAAFERAAMAGETPVLLTSPGVRPYVRGLIERFRPSTPVMSQAEVHAKIRLKAVAQV